MRNPNYKILPNGHEVSAAILVIDKNRGVLACHPTMQPKGKMYDIPKGHVELDEDDIDAAVREFEEETGLATIDKSYLIDKGIFPYIKHKDIHLFILHINSCIEDSLPFMKCKSYFTNKQGRNIPEMNGYVVLYEGQFHLFMPAMCNLITKIFKDEFQNA